MAHNGSRYFRWKALTAAAESCLIKWSKTFRATLRVLRQRPRILVLPILVFTALLASGLASVLTASQVAVRNARDLASNGIGSQVALSLEEALLIATFGSELLAAVTSRLADCSVLAAQWADLSTDIMSRVDGDVVKQLELDFAGVIWKTWPPLEGELAEILYGRDLLREPDDRTGMIYMLKERRTLMLGPYNCRAGFKCGFVVTPVFLPAPSEAYDWGCGLQPYNCSDLCWDPVNKTKFHSQVSTMINLEPLLTGTDARLQSLASRGYLYKLWQANTSPSNPYFLLGNSSRLPVDPMTLPISLYNVQWYLEIAPAAGWVPAWRSPCIAVVVVGSVAISLLVLWLLVSKEQHNRLLKAMLPVKVIKQLQAGENAIAQEYSDVTVLFSDIVGYTTVASQLSPCQVVTLLNELFGMFDELTQRNGVYKVETIGDALMCVAGCPVPDDAVRNAVRAANMALDMVRAVEQFKPSLEGVRVQIRVGLHSGPVVAGVVGKKMPRFCLFGDTVNTASRMESSSLPMQIQVSDATATLLRGRGEDFVLESRGIIDIKGKGAMETFFLAAGASPLPRGKSFLAALQRPAALVVRPPPHPAKLQHAIGAGSGANGSYSDLLRAATSGGRRSGDRHISAEDRSSGKRSSRMIYSGGNGGSRALADVSEEGVALSGAAAVGSQSSKLMGADAGASDVEASSFEMRPAKASCQADGILAEVSGDDAVGGGAAATSWPSPAAPAYGCGSAEPSPVHRPLKRRFLDGRAAADCPPREPTTHTGVAGVDAGAAAGGAGAEAEAGAVFAPPSFAEGLGEEVGVTAVHAGGTPATPGLHRLAVHSGNNPHGPREGVRSPAGAAPDTAADDWATRSHAQDPDPDHQQQQRPESSFATRSHAALRAMADAAKAQAGTDSALAVLWRRPAAVAAVACVAGARGVGAAGSLRATRRLQDDETVTAGDATATVAPPATAAARAQAQVGELDAEPLWSAHSWSRQLTAETPHAADARSVSMRQALRGLFRNLTSGRSSEAGSGSATPHAPHAATAAAPAQPPSSQRRVRALCHSSSLDLLHSATRSAAATEPGQAAIGQLASLGSSSATPTRIFPLGSGARSRGISGAFQLLPQTALATSVGARTPTTRPSTETGVVSVAVATHGQQH